MAQDLEDEMFELRSAITRLTGQIEELMDLLHELVQK